MNRNLLRWLIRAGALFTLIVVCFTPAWSQFTGVLTQHNDNTRSGQNNSETILTPQNIKAAKFGKVFSFSVDGQIYSQPLYMPNVSVPGKGTHNVVFVETQNDSVYMFDADNKSSKPIWQVSFIDRAHGITPVSCGTDGNTDISCGVYPVYGINSTPVIDPDTNTMYLVVRTAENGQYFQRLHAISIFDGTEKFGGPVVLTGSVPGTGSGSKNGIVTFNQLADVQRTALLLLNGTVYIGWAGSQHGWIMGYDSQTLQRTAIFNPTANAQFGGIWGGGNGLAADDAGNIYGAVGDALFDADSGGVDYGDSMLKLDPTLTVLDYFTPSDQACRKANDLDLGSSGAMLLPTQGGAVANELVIAGKGGAPCDANPVASRIYLLNRDNLGKYNPKQDQAVQEVAGAPAGYWSSPAYFQGTSAIYYGGVQAEGGHGDNLKMFGLNNGVLSSVPLAQSTNVFPVGATPSISSSGTTNGIVWAVDRQDSLGTVPGSKPSILYAYDATNMTMLYNSEQERSQTWPRDRGGCGNKYAVPTIANGRVYVPTQNELDVFGRLPAPKGAKVFLSNACWTFKTSTIGTKVTKLLGVSNSGIAPLTISKVAFTGAEASDFTQTSDCTTVAPGAKCRITVTFTASKVGPETAYLMITDNAVGSPHNVYMLGVGKK